MTTIAISTAYVIRETESLYEEHRFRGYFSTRKTNVPHEDLTIIPLIDKLNKNAAEEDMDAVKAFCETDGR